MSTNKSNGQSGNVADLLNNIYRCANKSSWYGKVAEEYDRTRPRYPELLLNRASQIAGLHSGSKVLELGAGPGIATVELAKLGLQVVALEPNLNACNLARQKCANYDRITIVNSTFEEWELREAEFDAIFATTSFHWIDPQVRLVKTASALKTRGCLILLWNTPPQPSDRILESLKPIYQSYAPELKPPESIASHQQSIDRFGEEMLNSVYYRDLVEESIISQVSYAVDDYLTLLTTLSPYIGLTTDTKNNLLTALKTELQQNYGEILDLSYLSMMQIGLKNK